MMEIKPDFEKDKLARLLGSNKPYNFSRSINKKVEKLAIKLKEVIKPGLYYRILKVESIKHGSIYLQGDIGFKGVKLSKAMKGCHEVICFIGTIGEGIEKEIARLMDENCLSEAYILDSMGSVAVEDMVEKFYQRLKTGYQAQGKGVTLRFSPGYCDWPITDQKKLFSFFDSAPIGVELMDSCLMMPRKSISGVFGAGHFKAKPSLSSYNPCLDCKKRGCMARRK